MASITSLGTGSGLDLEGILTKLMTVEQLPLTQLANKEAGLQSKLSAFGTLQGSLSGLQTAAQALKNTSTFTAAKTSVSDSSVLSAVANAGAAVGTYSISVGQLAQAQAVRTNSSYAATTETFNTGTISISVGGAPAIDVAISASNNSLSGIRAAINAANAGVTASIVNDGTTNRLLLVSNTTGLTAGTVSVNVYGEAAGTGTHSLTDLNSANLVQTQAPQDADFSVNGLHVTRSSNTVSDVIENATLNLTKAGTLATPVTAQLTISKDSTATQTALTNFVSAYNAAIKQIQTLTAYDAANKKGSVLTGDSTLRTISSQLTALIFNPVTGLSGGISTLSDVGISFKKDGTLTLNTTKAQAALSDSTKDVAGLFTSTTSGNLGAGVAFDNLLTSVLGLGGAISTRTVGINKSIKSLTDQYTAISSRLTKIEATYRAQFTALDASVSSMQHTSTYLTQQISYLQSLATGVSTSSSSK